MILEEYVPSTCTTHGHKKYRCADCGKFVSSESLDLEPHDPEDEPVITKAATCTESGEGYYMCKNCGQIIPNMIVFIQSPGHKWMMTVVYGDDGKAISETVCEVCGEKRE